MLPFTRHVQTAGGEVEVEERGEADGSCCVRAAEAGELARVARALVASMDTALDIEFCVEKETGRVLVLQAR